MGPHSSRDSVAIRTFPNFKKIIPRPPRKHRPVIRLGDVNESRPYFRANLTQLPLRIEKLNVHGCKAVCWNQGCQLGFWGQICILWLFFNYFVFFYFWRKAKWNSAFLAFFGELDIFWRIRYFMSIWQCWVRVASSTWNVLWLWNTNKGRPQTQVQKTTWRIGNNIIEQQRQRRSIRMSVLKVASLTGLNPRRMKLEQCNNQRHLFYNDIVLCIYLNCCIFILHMYCKSHPGRE